MMHFDAVFTLDLQKKKKKWIDCIANINEERINIFPINDDGSVSKSGLLS